MKCLIERDQRLDVLCHVDGGCSKQFFFFAWVPKWSFPYACFVLGHDPKKIETPYKASLGRPAKFVFNTDPGTLIVEGVVCDRVSKAGPAYYTN